MAITNTADLLQTLHYCERYNEGDAALIRIRVEVDNTLYALYREQLRLSQRVNAAVERVHYAAGDERRWSYVGGRSIQRWVLDHFDAEGIAAKRASEDTTYIGTRAKEALQDLATAREALQACKDAQKPLQDAYRARPWTRAFLVTDGHVHSSMECSTCFPTTEFSWLTQFSDHNEDEIVKAAGERACTVCYPSAPTLRDFEKASALFTEEEAERNAAREQRKAEKAARDAKKIEKALTPDGSEFVVRGDGWSEHFKTERAALQWATHQLAMAKSSYYSKIVTKEHLDAVEAILRASAAKHDKRFEDLLEEVDKKAVAKARKEYS